MAAGPRLSGNSTTNFVVPRFAPLIHEIPDDRDPRFAHLGARDPGCPGPALRAPGSGKQPTYKMQFPEGGRCMAAGPRLSGNSTTNFVVPRFAPLGSRDPGCPGPALRWRGARDPGCPGPALRWRGARDPGCPGPALRAPGSGKQPTYKMQFPEGGRCMAAGPRLSGNSTTNFLIPRFAPLGSRDPGCPGPALRAPGSGNEDPPPDGPEGDLTELLFALTSG
jgi:hypothetical protein